VTLRKQKEDNVTVFSFCSILHWQKACGLFEGHGVTQIFLRIGNPATVKTDEPGILRQFLYLLHFLIACQNTDMTGMLSVTNLLFHFSPPPKIECSEITRCHVAHTS
jgi:hypothetical protein